MAIKKYQGKLIRKDNPKTDIFVLKNNLEKAILTKVKIGTDSSFNQVNIFGEVPDYLINKEICITNSIEKLDDKRVSVTQYFFSEEQGLRIVIRDYTPRSMQYINI